jgi:iron complex outermembrane receptor protein
MHYRDRLRASAPAIMLAASSIVACGPTLAAPSASAQIGAADTVETVLVTGERTEADVPNTVENIDADQAQVQINFVDTEDMLQYAPSIVVRKRHYGDTQDPLATRTSGVGASARNLLFVDGILISSPIGNNNSSASPHFGIAQPEDVSNFQIVYGPFAAEYSGGSIGAVVNITTKMPSRFMLYADALSAVQSFDQYSTNHAYGTWQLSAGIGDKEGAFSWRLSATHLNSLGQPLAYVTLVRPSATSTTGTPLTGAFNDVNRTGAPIIVIGAGGIEGQTQDTDTLKLAYDFADGWQATYTASVFHQNDDAGAQSYLRNALGVTVYAGSANVNGYNYNIAASSFSSNIYDWNQTHLAQAISLKSSEDSALNWEFVGSDYNYLDDNQRVPSIALPSAVMTGGAGTINRLSGTGWYTFDAKVVWKGWAGQELSVGAHRDAETFSQIKYNAADWTNGGATSLAADSQGRTATNALWIQDVWSFTPVWQATLGGRFEDWRAYDGYNFSASPTLSVNQPKLSTSTFSPKLSVAWTMAEAWALSASAGVAYRMPTVTELYQAVTTGTQLTVPDPNLKPEHANSYELAAEYKTNIDRVRLSFFREDVSNALLSQSAPLVAGSTTLYSYVQNVDRTRVQGVELIASQNDVFIDGLELSGSLTYANGRTVKDIAFPEAQGKYIPQLPKLRGEVVATFRATDALAVTLGAHYSDRSFGTVDNSDPVSHTFQGFDGYMVVDTRAHYQIDNNWSASIGIDNLTNDKYFLYHPFPQRTFVIEIHYAQ